MSVHYKFKSALDYDTVTFDGLHISVGDLKSAISQQKRIGKTSDFDLQITNAQTKEGKFVQESQRAVGQVPMLFSYFFLLLQNHINYELLMSMLCS